MSKKGWGDGVNKSKKLNKKKELDFAEIFMGV